MNESNINDFNHEKNNIQEAIKRRRPLSTSSESSPNDYDYDTELSNSEHEYNEVFDETYHSISLFSTEWLSQNTERPPFAFTEQPGITFDALPKKVPLLYLEKFLDDEFIKLITDQTNLYAKQFFENDPELKPRSKIQKWKDTSKVEMKTFLGLLILQGIIEKPTAELYFSRRRSIETSIFHETMSENRFGLLCKCLHFADNLAFDPNTSDRKTYKIDPIINLLSKKFKSLYICERDVCVDETLSHWKPRIGLKLYTLRESQSGYIHNMILYSGEGINFDLNCPKEVAVLKLTLNLLNKGYRIYMDQDHTSIHLAEFLCQNNTDIVGIMRLNKEGIPTEIKTQKLKKHEYIARFKGKLMVLKWKEKRNIVVLTSIHNDEMTVIEKKGIKYEKPNVILECNKKVKMNETDMADAIAMSHKAARDKQKKFYKIIFLRLLNMCCLNAYILYKKDNGHLDRLHFLLECAEQLVISKVKSQPLPSTSGMFNPQSRLIERHFPEQMKNDVGKIKARKCRVCYKKGLRKESTYWCPNCEATLCVNTCFKIYHTEPDF